MNSYPAAARDLRPVRWGSLSGPSAVRPVISWFDRDPPAAIKTQSSSHGGRDLPLISGRFRLSAVLAAAALTIPLGLVAAPAQAASSYVSWTTAKVVRWVDGDTVVTSKGTVRLIGVDTPERGRCGAGTATAYAKRLAPAGSTIKLGNPKSVRDRDRYNRNLRYVDRGQDRPRQPADHQGRQGPLRRPRRLPVAPAAVQVPQHGPPVPQLHVHHHRAPRPRPGPPAPTARSPRRTPTWTAATSLPPTSRSGSPALTTTASTPTATAGAASPRPRPGPTATPPHQQSPTRRPRPGTQAG